MLRNLIYKNNHYPGVSGDDKMKSNIEEKKERVRDRLEMLLPQMAQYFNCEPDDVKISRISFYNGRYSAALSYRHIDKDRSDLRKIITSIYYFDIEGEYLDKDGLWYEGQFYEFDNLEPFFEAIKEDIEEFHNN